mmetsp:Transcript_71116/g.141321  ORF Transcript_71116/g.141321 Transcript_71116/m.141321 type:complete len:97 (+) Transcript_71116:380-670(+)
MPRRLAASCCLRTIDHFRMVLEAWKRCQRHEHMGAFGQVPMILSHCLKIMGCDVDAMLSVSLPWLARSSLQCMRVSSRIGRGSTMCSLAWYMASNA